MTVKIYDLRRRSYVYALEVIKCLKMLPDDYVSRTLEHQLLRSTTSVGANIVEAQAASSKKDFANFYTHALKSAHESRFWFHLLRDSGKVAPEIIEPLVSETGELANILAASVLTIKGRRRF